MTDPERKRTSRPSNEGYKKRPFRKPYNRDQRRTSNRSRSRPSIYINMEVSTKLVILGTQFAKLLKLHHFVY
ncbi:MAG: hypothetical protein ACTSRK_15600 [Promethearchaeota archaeon]